MANTPWSGLRGRRGPGGERVHLVFEVCQGPFPGSGRGGKAAAPVILGFGDFDPAGGVQFVAQLAEEGLVDCECVFQFRLEYATGPGAAFEQGEHDSGVLVEERRGRDRFLGCP